MKIALDSGRAPVSLYIFKWVFLAYIAVLPIAGTIALRNLLLLTLVVFSFIWALSYKSILTKPGLQKIEAPIAYWLFFIYLLIFPFISQDADVAFTNLRSQWGPAVLAWFVGIAAGHLLSVNQLGVRMIIVASSFLVIIHLLEVALAWSGLLGTHVQIDMTWGEMWSGFQSIFINGYHWPPEGGIPWKFRGFDDMHGNVGNAGLQAIALITAFHFTNKANRPRAEYFIPVALIFTSFFISGSRGSVGFGLALVAIAVFILKRDQSLASQALTQKKSAYLVMGGLVAMICFAASIPQGSNWDIAALAKKFEMASSIQDPLHFICTGEDKAELLHENTNPRAHSPEVTNEAIGGDGARLLLMRAGLQLVLQNPLGLDGSRQSYQKLITAYCSHPPRVQYAHAHQGWINMALGLGWAGAALYFFMLVETLLKSFRQFSSAENNRHPVTASLVLLSLFWIMRGFLDAVYQDHFLQMQGVLLGFLYAQSRKIQFKFI